LTRPTGPILALDLATRTGWAEGDIGSRPRHGSERFAPAGADRSAVLAGAIRHLQRRFMVFPPAMVVFEAPMAPNIMAGRTNANTARTLIGLAGLVEAICQINGIYRVREAKVSDIRRWFVGGNPRGEIGKKLTIDRLRAMGFDPQDDNAADALALWHYTAAQYDPDLDLQVRTGRPMEAAR
jgi:hypothetical protein